MKNNFLYPVAVIDVGSNSVRLMLVSGSDKRKFLITTRLAEGKSNNRLAKTSVLRTANAVALFFDKALKEGCKSVFIFATAAVRNSENGEEFTKEVKSMTGLDVHVVSGEIEAELALLGALNGKDGGVIDVGGASTEIAVKEGGDTVYFSSYKVGAVSLKNEFNGDREKISLHLKNTFICPKRRFLVDFYAVGGTVCALASINLNLKKYDTCAVDGSILSVERVKSLVNELSSLSPEEISIKYPTAKSRADIISGGAQILYEIMKCYNLSSVCVSESDNLEGYLEYILNEKAKN